MQEKQNDKIITKDWMLFLFGIDTYELWESNEPAAEVETSFGFERF